MNNINLSGRLTHEPKLTYSRKDTPICKFSIANHDTKRDDLYFDLICFGVDAENLHKLFKKGDEISCTGHIEQGKDGHEIIADILYFDRKFSIKIENKKKQITNKTSITDDNF